MNPVLQSEAFENAAFALRDSLNRFETGNFDASCLQFSKAVDKMGRILGMQAENEMRKHHGQALAYCDQDFFNA